MKINKEEVMYIAKLAKLKFTDEEALELAQEFKGILQHFNSLKESELKIDNLEDEEDKKLTEFRDDIAEDFKDNSKLFSNVKDREREYVKIPKVID